MQQLEKDCQSSSVCQSYGAHESSDGGCTGEVGDHMLQNTATLSSQPRSSCNARQAPFALSDSEEDVDTSEGGSNCGAPDDVTVKRARFKTMRDRFVDGQEPGFRYAPLDEDSELDDIVEQ